MEDFRSNWEKKFHLAITIYEDTQRLLINQDAKAGVMVTLNCFVLGVISNEFQLAKKLYTAPILPFYLKMGMLVLIIGLFFCLVASTLNAFATFFPRMGIEDKIQRVSLNRLIFCAHILEKGSPDNYQKLISSSTDQQLLMEVCAQIWQVSGIFKEKFRHTHLAVFYTKWGFLFSLLLTVFIECFQWFD